MPDQSAPALRAYASALEASVGRLLEAMDRKDWHSIEREARSLLSTVSKVLNRAQVLVEFAGPDR